MKEVETLRIKKVHIKMYSRHLIKDEIETYNNFSKYQQSKGIGY